MPKGAGLPLRCLLLLATLWAQGAEEETPAGAELVEQAAPGFALTTVSGRAVDLDAFDGYILVLYFLPQDDLTGLLLGGEIDFFFGRGREDEIRYLGISPLPSSRVQHLVTAQAWSHDIALDPDGEATRRFLGTPRPAVLVIDPHGTVRFFRDASETTFKSALRTVLRELLRELNGEIAAQPKPEIPWRQGSVAPAFTAPDLEGKTRSSAEFRGRPLLLYFFEMDCTRCEEVSGYVRDMVLRHGERGAQAIGVVSRGEIDALRSRARAVGLSFPILLDRSRRIRRAFGATTGDPDLVWVDPQGNVRWRELGAPTELRRLLDLQAEVLLGTADPARFAEGVYQGFRVCRTCHEAEYGDWLSTPHAVAGKSLIPDRAYQRDDCVGCHVTGYRRPGGYDPAQMDMFQVQCEACHGPGGGHGRDPEIPTLPWEARCLTCHVGPYVLKQPIDVSLLWVNHRDTPDAGTLFAYLPERQRDMEKFRRTRIGTAMFQPATPYVGSERCRKCHEAIHDAWKRSPHAGALESLRQGGHDDEGDCLRCHVTGAGSLTGYRGRSTPGLGGVGCEACHGPGGDHVDAPTALARWTIYGLAPDCDACQPEAACRACHDAANDPDFRMPERTDVFHGGEE